MPRLKNVQKYAYKVVGSFGYSAYAACVAHCLMEYLGDFVICVGPSMEPTIFSKSIVITERISVHQQKINRGDIVVSKSPLNPKHYICKRVKGIPGDKIPLGDSFKIVPKGHLWLEGDNKMNSSDSRNYGPVPQGLITGRVIFVIWPFTNFRKLTT